MDFFTPPFYDARVLELLVVVLATARDHGVERVEFFGETLTVEDAEELADDLGRHFSTTFHLEIIQ